MEPKEKTFHYSYSAKQQKEIQNIRKKYLNTEESNIDKLRKLDNSTTQKATILSLILGISGTLLFGIGMCCCLVWTNSLFIPGIIIGITGIAMASFAYPIYNRTLKKERQKIAPEILKLTEELLK